MSDDAPVLRNFDMDDPSGVHPKKKRRPRKLRPEEQWIKDAAERTRTAIRAGENR